MKSLALSLVSLLLVAAVGCQRKVQAQVQEDPLAPIRCFQLVNDELSTQSALELCVGALSAAPGQCFISADDAYPELADSKSIQLCRGATSLDPLTCFQELDARGTLTEDQMIAYCATTCPTGPAPPQSSSPDCVAAAEDRTDLTLQQIGQLCVASHSAGPVDCFNTGEAIGTLTEDQLLQLCTTAVGCQYLYGAPIAGGTVPGY
jgi:hypothetical protein